MTINELGDILSDMYQNASNGDSVVMIHLFGIQYAEQIKSLGVSCETVARAAHIHPSYKTEISKGIKLSQYVNTK